MRLGTWVPFGQVPARLAAGAGWLLNRETGRRPTEAAGAGWVAGARAGAPPLAPPADPDPASSARRPVSADGALVRLQSGNGVEVKTLASGPVPARTTAPGQTVPQTTELSYFSRHASAAQFIRLAAGEMHRRGGRAAAAGAGIMDGAGGRHGLLDYPRPAAPFRAAGGR